MKHDIDFSDTLDLRSQIFQGLPSAGNFHLSLGPIVPGERDDELMLSLSEGQMRVLRARIDQALRTHEYHLRDGGRR